MRTVLVAVLVLLALRRFGSLRTLGCLVAFLSLRALGSLVTLGCARTLGRLGAISVFRTLCCLVALGSFGAVGHLGAVGRSYTTFLLGAVANLRAISCFGAVGCLLAIGSFGAVGNLRALSAFRALFSVELFCINTLSISLLTLSATHTAERRNTRRQIDILHIGALGHSFDGILLEADKANGKDHLCCLHLLHLGRGRLIGFGACTCGNNSGNLEIVTNDSLNNIFQRLDTDHHQVFGLCRAVAGCQRSKRTEQRNYFFHIYAVLVTTKL